MLSPTAHALCLLALTAAVAGWLDPPDLDAILVTLEPGACADAAAPLAVVLVKSHPNYSRQRALSRQTYPAAELERRLAIRRVFVLASLRDDPATQAQVIAEHAEFGDVLQLSYVDDYRLLTFKVLHSLRWATQLCPGARFLASADDDVFIDYYSLARYLEPIRGDDADAIRGHLKVGTISNRDPNNYKRFVSRVEYPAAVEPNLVWGMFYACSLRSAARLLEAVPTVPFLHADDIYVTGLVADVARVRRLNITHLTGTDRPNENCCLREKDAYVYQCKYLLFQQYTSLMTLKEAKRLKDHGAFCYQFKCDKFYSGLAGSDGVTCF